MIAIGGTNIVKAYLGSTALKNIAIGDELLLSSEPSPLPYDAEIEYIESTGTQFVDTGVVGNNNCKVELKVRTTNDSIMGLFGARIYSTTLSRAYSIFILDGARVQFNYANAASNQNYSINTDRILTLDENKCYIDGNKVNTFTANTFTSPNTFIICSSHTGTYGDNVDSRCYCGLIYYCKIWSNGILVRDYIPVRVGQKGYLYDKVSGTLFGNVGTGDFILGNDIT